MVGGRGSGRSLQLKSVSRTDRVRLCGHVKLSFLNSDYPEYPDRKVGVRACATNSAYCGLCSRQSFHSSGTANPFRWEVHSTRKRAPMDEKAHRRTSLYEIVLPIIIPG